MSCAAMVWSDGKEWDVSNGAKSTGCKEIPHFYYSISHAHFRVWSVKLMNSSIAVYSFIFFGYTVSLR